MGFFDNLRGLFSGSNNTEPVEVENEGEKLKLREKIFKAIKQIEKIRSMDTSIRNFSNIENASDFRLKRKSLSELKKLESDLSTRLSELNKQKWRVDPEQERRTEAQWTGKTIPGMSDSDLKRSQESDDLWR